MTLCLLLPVCEAATLGGVSAGWATTHFNSCRLRPGLGGAAELVLHVLLFLPRVPQFPPQPGWEPPLPRGPELLPEHIPSIAGGRNAAFSVAKGCRIAQSLRKVTEALLNIRIIFADAVPGKSSK